MLFEALINKAFDGISKVVTAGGDHISSQLPHISSSLNFILTLLRSLALNPILIPKTHPHPHPYNHIHPALILCTKWSNITQNWVATTL